MYLLKHISELLLHDWKRKNIDGEEVIRVSVRKRICSLLVLGWKDAVRCKEGAGLKWGGLRAARCTVRKSSTWH